MARPPKTRRVGFIPDITYFKPAGVPMRQLDEVVLTVEELEAIRLKDLEDLEQADAAELMQVSRPTFRRILVSAAPRLPMLLPVARLSGLKAECINSARKLLGDARHPARYAPTTQARHATLLKGRALRPIGVRLRIGCLLSAYIKSASSSSTNLISSPIVCSEKSNLMPAVAYNFDRGAELPRAKSRL